jgi:peptidyl-prolyl cis-trans isomerase D
LRAFVTASVTISPEEVQEDFKKKNTTYDLTYVAINAGKLAEKIQPSDQELRAYYEQHKTDYRILEPQKKIRYLYIEQEKAGEKLQISDKDLHDEFDKLSPENKQAGVKVQQILLKVARKDLDAQVEQKAKDLVTKLRGTTGQATEQVFADMARGNSEDPATAAAGGFLPHLVKKNLNKPDALYERALSSPATITFCAAVNLWPRLSRKRSRSYSSHCATAKAMESRRRWRNGHRIRSRSRTTRRRWRRNLPPKPT